jgi:Flp pilus assembly protein TadD
MTRFTSSLIALLVCAPALAGCASEGALSSNTDKKPVVADNGPGKTADVANVPTDVEAEMRKAQAERLAGQYDDAIRILSQLMLVASDDHRVVGEYGKTLAEKGRASEAVQFLTRAVALQPAEWSYYSALGVAYDQTGDQNAARAAYEQALKLKPGDAAILNNYALSRMLAKDPDGARALIERAQKAGGASDPKIARNIELIEKLAPPALKTAADTAPVEHAPVATITPVTSEKLPAPAAKPQVVMQAVPSDPLAGPAKPANHAPTPLSTAKAAAAPKPQIREAHTDGDKPAVAKTAMPAPKPELREAHADGDKPAAKPETAKPEAKTAKADAKAVKPLVADVKAAKDVKAADVKPDGKAPAKPAEKNGIPALRQTASAY